MPNRIVREGINSSTCIASLDWGAEVFYRRLMNHVDDYGACELVSERYLCSVLYPSHDKVREGDVTRWIAACEKAGAVLLYTVAGKRYILILGFQQQTRSAPKCPAPEVDGKSLDWSMIANASRCQQLHTLSVVVSVVVSGGVVEGVKEKNIAPRPENFSVPSVDEVKAYMEERKWPDSESKARQFVDFYECKGWMVGKNKMKKWRAAVRTWELSSANKPSKQNRKTDFDTVPMEQTHANF